MTSNHLCPNLFTLITINGLVLGAALVTFARLQADPVPSSIRVGNYHETTQNTYKSCNVETASFSETFWQDGYGGSISTGATDDVFSIRYGIPPAPTTVIEWQASGSTAV